MNCNMLWIDVKKSSSEEPSNPRARKYGISRLASFSICLRFFWEVNLPWHCLAHGDFDEKLFWHHISACVWIAFYKIF